MAAGIAGEGSFLEVLGGDETTGEQRGGANKYVFLGTGKNMQQVDGLQPCMDRFWVGLPCTPGKVKLSARDQPSTRLVQELKIPSFLGE
jgi:hypothetical protein